MFVVDSMSLIFVIKDLEVAGLPMCDDTEEQEIVMIRHKGVQSVPFKTAIQV